MTYQFREFQSRMSQYSEEIFKVFGRSRASQSVVFERALITGLMLRKAKDGSNSYEDWLLWLKGHCIITEDAAEMLIFIVKQLAFYWNQPGVDEANLAEVLHPIPNQSIKDIIRCLGAPPVLIHRPVPQERFIPKEYPSYIEDDGEF
jgi:hypothetical protein